MKRPGRPNWKTAMLDFSSAKAAAVLLTPTEAAVTERISLTADKSAFIIENRLHAMELVSSTVQREGADRILVQVPGLSDRRRLSPQRT
jgi:preprotein translocase subunit SecD